MLKSECERNGESDVRPIASEELLLPMLSDEDAADDVRVLAAAGASGSEERTRSPLERCCRSADCADSVDRSRATLPKGCDWLSDGTICSRRRGGGRADVLLAPRPCVSSIPRESLELQPHHTPSDLAKITHSSFSRLLWSASTAETVGRYTPQCLSACRSLAWAARHWQQWPTPIVVRARAADGPFTVLVLTRSTSSGGGSAEDGIDSCHRAAHRLGSIID